MSDTAPTPPGAASKRESAWARLQQRLMPEHPPAATRYGWAMLLLGSGALATSMLEVASQSPLGWAWTAGGVLLAVVTALFPVRIPRTDQSFSAGDIFIYIVLLSNGAAAACIVAAIEALVSSCRSSSQWTTRLISTAITSASMALCGLAFEGLLRAMGHGHAGGAGLSAGLLTVTTLAFGGFYTVTKALLISNVGRLERGEALRWKAFLDIYAWVAGANMLAAALAALLVVAARDLGWTVLLGALPVIGLLLSTLHFFDRQQAADAAARQAEARQREAEMASRHLMALETSERRFHRAFTHASIGMALVGVDGTVRLANPALQLLLGTGESLNGSPLGDHVSLTDGDRFARLLSEAADGSTELLPLELTCRRSDGREVVVSVSCSRFSEDDGSEPSLILQAQDVTARRHAEAQLHHRAFHDKLTGLPNRERFNQALEQQIQRTAADPDHAFAVLFLDFDRFKLINDSKGHGVGDEFLVQASERLSRCLRRADMLARLGGDEFAILAVGLTHDTEAVELAERLLAVLREPLELSTLEITATASIGMTFSSMGYHRPEDMLRDADIAMYRAKSEGKARYALFDVALHREVSQRVRLEADLRQALASGTLSIAFQPLQALDDGSLRGFEALARWIHPYLGPVSPGTFVSIAEESGLVVDLTHFMVRASCRHLAAWLHEHPHMAHLHVHVNASGRDLIDPEFVACVRAALDEFGLPARHLVVELTENILMAQLAGALHTLEALRALGVGLSIDDFGTGYSSLSHLSTLPIDSLKIDMSFVRRLSQASKESAVIRAIVLLGSSLGKTIIAEGIETQDQLDQLAELGCQIGQGYHLSRPLTPDAVSVLMRAHAGGQVRVPRASPERKSLRLVVAS